MADFPSLSVSLVTVTPDRQDIAECQALLHYDFSATLRDDSVYRHYLVEFRRGDTDQGGPE
jgi:hypothetical protein